MNCINPSRTSAWRIVEMQSSMEALHMLGQVDNAITTQSLQEFTLAAAISIHLWTIFKSDSGWKRTMWFDSHFTKWLPYHAIAILISGAAANFLLFSCVRNFFFPGALSLAGWATLNITNIVPRNWHLCHLERICGMLMACCSPDTTWVWNRIPTKSYCPNLPIILHHPAIEHIAWLTHC